MYILDTNTVSAAIIHPATHFLLTERILSTDPARLYVTIITVEEVVRGALAGDPTGAE